MNDGTDRGVVARDCEAGSVHDQGKSAPESKASGGDTGESLVYLQNRARSISQVNTVSDIEPATEQGQSRHHCCSSCGHNCGEPVAAGVRRSESEGIGSHELAAITAPALAPGEGQTSQNQEQETEVVKWRE